MAAQPAAGGRSGGDALAFFYGLWACAALGRVLYQYLLRQPATLLPTHLSAAAGLLYLLIIAGLRRRSPRAWRLTLALLLAELGGVLVVGTLDVVWRLFPYATVWSQYGSGYLWMPLLLPLAGLAWLLRAETRRAYGVGSDAEAEP